MTDKPARQKQRPSAEWGRRAVELAQSIGKSKQDLARESGYTGGPKDPTIDRLQRGEGSLQLAYAVRRTLRGWGIDVSLLPPLDGDDEVSATGADAALNEGIDLIRKLWRYASDEKYQVELSRLRALVHAYELIAEGTGEQKKRQP